MLWNRVVRLNTSWATVVAVAAAVVVTATGCAPEDTPVGRVPTEAGALGGAGIETLVVRATSTVPATQAVVSTAVDSFLTCAEAGFPIMESWPRQCRTADGRTFTEDIGNELELADQIRVFEPRPGDAVASPLVIRGEARGLWFFEASFPLRLEDVTGTSLGTAIATAQGEWMTEEFVPFAATLEFADTEGPVRLILMRDNPSGLPEHDAQLEMPLRVSP